jgi:hypothetical protein
VVEGEAAGDVFDADESETRVAVSNLASSEIVHSLLVASTRNV